MRKKSRKDMFSRHYIRALIFLFVITLLSLLAPYYWFFELFSHFVFQYTLVAIALSLLLLLSKRYTWSLSAVLLAMVSTYQLIPLWQENPLEPSKRYEEVRMLQYNVQRSNDNIEEMARWVISHSEEVDIVVLLEITEKWQMALQRIKWTYPYSISKSVSDDKQIVVLSKLLIDELEVKNVGQNEAPVVVMRGATSGYEIPFVLYGAHPPPPVFSKYAKRRNDLLEGVAHSIAKEQVDHKILVGDLNVTRFSPWFKKVTQISGLTDSNRGLGQFSTWPASLPNIFGVTIDHSLVTNTIKVSERLLGPKMGSDHFPILTRFEFEVPENT